MIMVLVNERYETPEVTTVEMLNEGVLCGSVPPGGSEDGSFGEDL
jgi:hypothetical protein